MTEISIDISDLDKADVLAALYNNSKAQGMELLQFDPANMSKEQAQEILETGQTYFDYLAGRVMKIDLKTSSLSPWFYDRDNGEGAVERVIKSLRLNVNNEGRQ